MKNTEIVLIRHGETEWNLQQRMQGHLNSNLTKCGQSQINLLGKRMKNMYFEHIYSSDTLRARLTAEAITKYSGNKIKFDERLREKNLGIFEGLTSKEAMELYPEFFHLFKTAGARYVIKNGESTTQLLERALNFVEEIRLNHPSERVILVTHGGVVRVLFKHILGIPLDASTRFQILNTGLFRMVWDKKWMVTQMGEISHLEQSK